MPEFWTSYFALLEVLKGPTMDEADAVRYRLTEARFHPIEDGPMPLHRDSTLSLTVNLNGKNVIRNFSVPYDCELSRFAYWIDDDGIEFEPVYEQR